MTGLLFRYLVGSALTAHMSNEKLFQKATNHFTLQTQLEFTSECTTPHYPTSTAESEKKERQRKESSCVRFPSFQNFLCSHNSVQPQNSCKTPFLLDETLPVGRYFSLPVFQLKVLITTSSLHPHKNTKERRSK
jgi:hypothetical protein